MSRIEQAERMIQDLLKRISKLEQSPPAYHAKLQSTENVFLASIGTSSTWTGKLSVNGTLEDATEGYNKCVGSGGNDVLKKRDGTFPLLAIRDGEQYSFYMLGREVMVIVLDSAGRGAGYYRGVMLKSFATPMNSTTDLVAGGLGEQPAGVNCIIANGAELGKSTHDLLVGDNVGTPMMGMVIGSDADTGLPIVGLNGYTAKDCSA